MGGGQGQRMRGRGAAFGALAASPPGPGPPAAKGVCSPAGVSYSQGALGRKQATMSRHTTKLLKAILSTMHYSGADSMIAPLTRGIGAIFMLHHVRPEQPGSSEPIRSLNITPQFLEAAIRQVRACGFEIISLDATHFRLVEGETRNPFVCFTFDDGYRDNLEYAYPIFKRHHLPFAIYVP